MKELVVVLYRVVIASWHIFGKVSKAQVDFPRKTENTNDEDEKQI